jgi:hypothetical protein
MPRAAGAGAVAPESRRAAGCTDARGDGTGRSNSSCDAGNGARSITAGIEAKKEQGHTESASEGARAEARAHAGTAKGTCAAQGHRGLDALNYIGPSGSKRRRCSAVRHVFVFGSRAMKYLMQD